MAKSLLKLPTRIDSSVDMTPHIIEQRKYEELLAELSEILYSYFAEGSKSQVLTTVVGERMGDDEIA